MENLERPIHLIALPEKPLVSVLVASFNYQVYLGEALASLLAQTYPHVECIVCDDGSTDASVEVATQFAHRDKRIKLISKPNGGVASALNAAYQECKGEIICLLDADDFYARNKLASVVRCFQQQDTAGMAFHAMHVVDREGRVLYRLPSIQGVQEGWVAKQVESRGGRWRSMPTSALAFRREVADLLFPIPEASFRSEADGFLNTLAPLLTAVAFIDQSLSRYRLHGNNLTGTTRLDSTVANRYLNALERKTQAVNRRLADLGHKGPFLKAKHHLNGQEHRFMRALFEGQRRTELLGSFGSVVRYTLVDDLYSPMRKALGIGAFLIAIALPVSLRSAWLTSALLQGKVRQKVTDWYKQTASLF